MICDTRWLDQPLKIDQMKKALDRLQAALGAGTVTAVIGPNGALAFKGWQQDDRAGYSDACAFRKLQARGSPELRRALARAEALAGRKLDPRAVAAGVHSHDGGGSWHPGH